jgi:hypothetical protein
MATPKLVEMEKQIHGLLASEQWWLVERILENLRKKADEAKEQAELAAMATDPAIQKEILQIQMDFAVADADGLEAFR